MRIPLRSVIAACWLGLATTAGASASDQRAPIAYRCDEVVVVGRVKVIGYTALASPGDLLGHGRYDMQVKIKRVLRGQEVRRVVPVSGISHGEMRGDADLWLVLTPAADGGYVIRTAGLPPYRLAARCD